MPLNNTRERRLSPGETSAAGHGTPASSPTRTAVRRRVWEIVEATRAGDAASRRFDVFILALIVLNVAAMVLESVRSIEDRFGTAFAVFEGLSLAVFAAEYAARLWSCVEDPRSRGGARGRLRWAVRPLSLVDLLVIVPLLATFGATDMRVLRAMRLFRLVCVLKAGRYLAALNVHPRLRPGGGGAARRAADVLPLREAGALTQDQERRTMCAVNRGSAWSPHTAGMGRRRGCLPAGNRT